MRSDRLRLRDLRLAYRLIGECRELGDDPCAWRTHMLEGLRAITGAQLALCMHISSLGSKQELITHPLDDGFLDTEHRALWLHYQQEQAYLDDPFHQRYYADFKRGIRTRDLLSVVRKRDWQQSRHFNDYIRPCGLADRITTSLFLPDMSQPTAHVIVLHRSRADDNYSRRMLRLVHLFHHELGTLLGSRLTLPGQSPSDRLPLQLQRILLCALEGDNEKQIAARLGLSPHTVNRHFQRLYSRFDVHSRTALMYECRHMLQQLRRLCLLESPS